MAYRELSEAGGAQDMTDKTQTEIVIEVTRYGEEQYTLGYHAGTWNGLIISDQMLGRIERIGQKKRAEFAKLILDMAKEHEILPEDSGYRKQLERRVRKAGLADEQ